MVVGLLKEAKRYHRAWWHVYLDNYAGGQIVDPWENLTEGNRLHDLADTWLKMHGRKLTSFHLKRSGQEELIQPKSLEH